MTAKTPVTDRVPADQIEQLVHARRHPTEHVIRGDYTNGRAYILHSAECVQRHTNLRDCPWSTALESGDVWLSTEEPCFVRTEGGQTHRHRPRAHRLPNRDPSMTTEPTIPAAIVEKAAKVGYENYCGAQWELVALETQAHWLSDTDAALAAVYADIQAEALREAAEAIDCRKAALTPGCGVDALDYDTPLDYGTDLAAWWLRARADELDGGKP